MATNAQIYCTAQQLVSDLNLVGMDTKLFTRIQAASRYINRRFGDFIPVKATKKYQGGGRNLSIDPCLQVTSIINNGLAVTDYETHPLNRHWECGPYTRLYTDKTHWDDEDIQVSGLWGKWSQTIDLGVTATQLIGAQTITVSNGSILSIGMVLGIDDEQELVTEIGSLTVLTAKLNGAIDATDDQIVIDNGAEANQGEVIQIGTERMRVLLIAGNTLAVTRGWDGTVRQSHADNAAISVIRTYQVIRGVNGTTAAAHTSAAVTQYVPPEDVNWLCRQIAGLMCKKADSGFAGKTGNAETGETFYFNEFPSQVKEVARNYRITQL